MTKRPPLDSSVARIGKLIKENMNNGVPKRVSLDELVPYARQARTKFDLESLNEFAATIKEDGFTSPLLVRPKDDTTYEIIAGERRWRAARLAGLTHVPVLVRVVDDEEADRLHVRENIQRENLDTLDLAARVQSDVKAAGGDLAKVAAKYGKSKPWVSKLASIGAGGAAMGELVDEGVTSDQAVLASVSSLERHAPERAKALTKQLKEAPATANKRSIAERFMKEERASSSKASAGKTAARRTGKRSAAAADVEPTWRTAQAVDRDLAKAAIVVALSPHSAFAAEFAQLQTKHGSARLAVALRHPDKDFAVVQFGNSAAQRRVYRANELQLLSIK